MYMSLDLFKCRCGRIECLSTREGSRASDFDTKHYVNPASPMRSKSHTHQLAVPRLKVSLHAEEVHCSHSLFGASWKLSNYHV